MALFVIIFLLLLAVPDAYIWWFFVRESANPLLNVLWWLPAALALAAAAAWMCGFYSEWLMKGFFAILLCLALPKLLFMLFSLAGIAAGHWSATLSAIIHIIGAAAAAALCGCCIYGFAAGTRRLEVRRADITFANLPAAFDGYRIVHISDLHVGTVSPQSTFLKKLVTQVNQLDADAILFTGDLVNSSPDELAHHLDILAGLKARDGVWSVLGNHDYCMYARYDSPDGAARSLQRLISLQRRMGWQLLLNECAAVERDGQQIAIVGVENDGRPPFPSRGDLKKALSGVADTTFTILLSHDPSHWRREVLPAAAADLTLSGHTHAMQFEIFGLSPSALSYPEWGGLYREGNRVLHVSKGAGGTAPFRFGAWPEVTVITLHDKKN